MRLFFILMLFIGMSWPVFAQDDDTITDEPILFDRLVTDTITEESIFDLWRIELSQGTVIVVTMTASEGLAPLIGLTDAGGDLVADSNTAIDASALPDAQPNSTATLEYLIPQSGRYTIIATRVGNNEGTTAGSYTLLVQELANGLSNSLQAVTFRCGERLVTTAATLEFFAQSYAETYRISVYGLDGFRPVIRLVAGQNQDLEDCASDSQYMGGDQITLPGGENIQLPDEDQPEFAARLTLGDGAALDEVQLVIGSEDGTSGRYIAVLEGFSLVAPEQIDYLNLRLGPLARDTDMLVYMVRVGSSRIDPLMTLNAGSDTPLSCDDAGRRGCEDVPDLENAGVFIAVDERSIIGNRFDAGIRLSPGDVEQQEIAFSSRASAATGDYAVLIMGELPASE